MLVAFHPLRLRGVGERGVCHAWGFRWGDSGGDESLQSLLLPPPGALQSRRLPQGDAGGCGKRLREETGDGTGSARVGEGGGQGWDFFYSSCLFEEVRAKDVPASSQLPSHPPRCPPRCGGTIPTGTASSQVPRHPPQHHDIPQPRCLGTHSLTPSSARGRQGGWPRRPRSQRMKKEAPRGPGDELPGAVLAVAEHRSLSR